MIETNPYGANGTTSDPREQVMWDFYVEGITKGIENAYEAAIKAGYEESTSRQITVRSWFLERKDRLKRKDILSKAEKVLDKTLTYSTEDEEGKVQVDLLRVQNIAAIHVTETLGKNEGYSKRTEQTGKDGEKLLPPIININDLRKNKVRDNDSNGESSELIEEN